MTNAAFSEKTAARRLCEMTGLSYQTCLLALRSRNLAPLHPNPAGVYPADIVETAAAALWMGGVHPTPHDAKLELLSTTITRIVHAHHPDAVSANIWMDDDDYPAVGRLWQIGFADGSELDSAYCEPVGETAMVWAAQLGDVLGLGRDDEHELRFPPAPTCTDDDRTG